jgi:putative membrane protein
MDWNGTKRKKEQNQYFNKLMKPRTYLWLAIFFGILIWSGFEPKDRLTWILEAGPAIIGLFIMAKTRASFPLTPLLYFWILLHCIVLMIGGKYTYAEVPLFDWISTTLGWERNNYDKVGHFMQGFVPALIAREILIRKQVVSTNGWRHFLIISICLAFSAFYEIIEWWAALLIGGNADAFLGTQGYIWDTQSDMAIALIGAISCLLLLTHVHDRQLSEL